jgi:hypothetical protein
MVDSNLEEDVLQDQTSDDGHDADDEAILAAFNKKLESQGLRGTFTSLDDAAKSLKEAKRIASEGGRKKGTQESQIDSRDELLQRLYRQQNPDIDLVWEDLQDEAARLKTDPISLFEKSQYYKGEAKLRADEKKQKENEAKLTKPTDGAAVSQKEITTKEDFDKLSPSEKADFIIKMGKKR